MKRNQNGRFAGWSTAGIAVLGGAMAITAAQAQAQAQAPAQPKAAAQAATQPQTLRVCAAANEAPYSTRDGRGFENRIAAVVADAMGRKVEFVFADKPAIYLVRDWLDKNLCDVVMGLDTGDPRVLTTRPYYRTAYVSVARADRDLAISSWSDERLSGLSRFAVQFHTPAEAMLKTIGKYEDNMSYEYSLVNFKSPRNQYVQIPGERLVSEVAGGEADVAIAFAPDVARYVKAAPQPLTMTVMADDAKTSDGKPLPQHFDQSMAVRRADEALLKELEAAIVKARPAIESILTQEGIPLLSRNS